MSSRNYGFGISKRKDGRWVARKMLPDDYENKKYYSFYGKTRKEAIDKMNEAEKRRKLKLKSKDISLRDYYNIWLKEVAPVRLKVTTINQRKDYFNRFILPNLGDKKLSKITSRDIRHLVMSEELNSSTGRKSKICLDSISTVLNSAEKDSYIARNPARGVEYRPYTPKQTECWSFDEMAKFLKVAEKSNYYPIYRLLAECGLRKGEVLGIKVNNIDFLNRVLEVAQQVIMDGSKPVLSSLKTVKSKRLIPLRDETTKMLEKYVQEKHISEGLLFRTRNNTPISPRNLSRDYVKVVKDAGVRNYSIHKMRHYFATRLNEKEVDLKTTQELMGHTSAATTMNYYQHSSLDLKRMAIERVV